MRFITSKNSIIQKILIILLLALILMFSILPNYVVYAEPVKVTEDDLPDKSLDILGSLLKQVMQTFAAVGDVIMGAFNNFMLGADGFTSTMLAVDDDNITDSSSWLYAGDVDDDDVDFDYGENTIDTSELLPWVHDKYDIPNFLYSPEAIFSNNIAALDVNFLNPNKYKAVSEEDSAKKAAKSSATGLRKVISDWYISFRNIAIVGLLSVLIYLGIRIVISSTAGDKAKYKENLQNWLVALCLVFFIHFIMSGLLMLTDKFNDLFDESANSGIVIKSVKPKGGEVKFNTNLIGFIRFNAQSASSYDALAYTILYMILIFYTCTFTIVYFKRFFYMAFLTMIAPLVALTYPIDKYGDGKAQAFNSWFKEYIMHLILQPVHLILYVSLVSSSMDLVKNNLLYGIIAIGFLTQAEKLIKKIFNLDGAKTTSDFGSFASGAIAMGGAKKVASLIAGKAAKGATGKGGSDSVGSADNGKIRMQNRGFLQSFASGNSGGQQQTGGQQTNSQSTNTQQSLGGGYSGGQQQTGSQQINSQSTNTQQNLGGGNSGGQQQTGGQQTNSQSTNTQQNLGSGNSGQQTNTQRNIKGYKNGWKGRVLKTYGNSLKKGAWTAAKMATRATAIAGGGALGLAAGAATGDFSKAWQYTVAGMGVGNSLGGAMNRFAGKTPSDLGKNFAKKMEPITNGIDKARFNAERDLYGMNYAAERDAIRQDARAEKNFYNNKEEQKKYEELAKELSLKHGTDIETGELMKKAFDYKRAGMDEKQIKRGLSMETDPRFSGQNDIHESMLDIMQMTGDYGKEYVLDEKKRKTMQDMIKSSTGESQQQDRIWNLYTEALGLNNLGPEYRMKH